LANQRVVSMHSVTRDTSNALRQHEQSALGIRDVRICSARAQPRSFKAWWRLATFNDVWDSSGSKKPPQWTIGANNASGDYLSLTFTTPQVDGRRKRGSLVDFDGGFITGDAVIGSFFGLPIRGFFSGDITPAQVSVPEPAALLLGLFVGLRRRCD
jgi:hypothetical protein